MEQCTNRSVGAIIERNGKFLMIERVNPPYGWAGVAGHVDKGKTPEEMIVIEIKEEANLDVVSSKFLFEEMVPWNNCRRSNDEGHYWYVFEVKTKGEVKPEVAEVKAYRWVTLEEMKDLDLEPIWKRWLERRFSQKLG